LKGVVLGGKCRWMRMITRAGFWTVALTVEGSRGEFWVLRSMRKGHEALVSALTMTNDCKTF
jgi:hypothetical protein